MFGTGKGAATAKPRPEKKPKPVSKAEQKLSTTLRPTAPEQVSAMNRVKRLTMPTDGWSMHDTHMQYVHDTLNYGVNALEDRGDVSRDITARMYGKLHKASLHLNEHAKHHSRGNYGDAAAHLELAGKELSEVGSTLSNHLGPNVTHGVDKQTYPISFMKNHATTVANNYRSTVAGITGPTAKVKGREYEMGAELRAPELKSGDEKKNTMSHMLGRVPAGYRMLSDTDSPSTRGLTRAQIEKGPTNTTAKRALSPAEERLATLPPKKVEMSGQAHYEKALSDLETKGKIHSDQLKSLRGKTFTGGAKTGENILDYLYESTGTPNPAKAGNKMSGITQTPGIRDREVK
jgi:hypothetical protein